MFGTSKIFELLSQPHSTSKSFTDFISSSIHSQSSACVQKQQMPQLQKQQERAWLFLSIYFMWTLLSVCVTPWNSLLVFWRRVHWIFKLRRTDIFIILVILFKYRQYLSFWSSLFLCLSVFKFFSSYRFCTFLIHLFLNTWYLLL